MGRLSCVVGGQWGSEGKGSACGWLAQTDFERGDQQVAVRVAGPNAGHSVVDSFGHKWALRQVPVAAVKHREATLVIGAGSEVDWEVLESEIRALDSAGFEVSERLVVDAQATLLEPEHRYREAELVGRIGSTGKGIGAARADRLMRTAKLAGESLQGKVELGDTAALLREALKAGQHVVIEGTQGFGLGLHAGHYPKTTSSDCRAIDFLAMAGVSPWAPWVGYDDYDVWVVLRTFPIRVAGNSGPMKREITWSEVGQPEERTTVTQKIRRVGEWDPELARAAVLANGGDNCQIALMMADYVFPELAGLYGKAELQAHHSEWLDQREAEIGAPIRLLGTGPDSQLELF